MVDDMDSITVLFTNVVVLAEVMVAGHKRTVLQLEPLCSECFLVPDDWR